MSTITRPLPREADARAIEAALQHAFDELEAVDFAVRQLDDVSGTEPDLEPFEAEHIAALALIRDDIEHNVERFAKIGARVADSIRVVAAIRGTQQIRRSDEVV